MMVYKQSSDEKDLWLEENCQILSAMFIPFFIGQRCIIMHLTNTLET